MHRALHTKTHRTLHTLLRTLPSSSFADRRLSMSRRPLSSCDMSCCMPSTTRPLGSLATAAPPPPSHAFVRPTGAAAGETADAAVGAGLPSAAGCAAATVAELS
eukprot:365139-Chlamydomonas_euryale.AAC.30